MRSATKRSPPVTSARPFVPRSCWAGIGMFIDRSIQLSGALNGSHIAALLEVARKRQQEPIDLEDDGDGNEKQDGNDE